jgi:hypothetical protein
MSAYPGSFGVEGGESRMAVATSSEEKKANSLSFFWIVVYVVIAIFIIFPYIAIPILFALQAKTSKKSVGFFCIIFSFTFRLKLRPLYNIM